MMPAGLGATPRADHAGEDWFAQVSRDEPGGASATPDRVQVAFGGMLFGTDSPERHIAAAYAATGPASFAALRGRFAFVLRDPSINTAFVVRDPLGTHPLFYAETGRALVASVTPQRLIREPGVSRALNTVALAEQLCRRWPAADESFFAGIRRLPAGRLLRVTPGSVRVERYWDPAPAGEPMRWLSEDEVDRFDSLLEQSIDRCLSLGRSAIFLSGGLDSISVAAVAADRCATSGRARPLALSLGFPEPECDERLRQASVAKTLGLPLHLTDFWDAVGPRGLLMQALELNATLASPLMNTWGPAYQALARRARASGVETILTGMGGDEWLTVSPRLTADLLARGRVLSVASYVRTMLRSHTLGRLAIVRNILWSHGLRPLAGRAVSRLAPEAWDRRRAARRVAGDPDWIAPDAPLRAALRIRAPRHLGPADPPGGFYVHEMRATLNAGVSAWELEEQHQFGRAAGVAFAHPYWDADLVDALLRTPPDLLSRDGRSKGLVRDTVARRFPSLGLDRQRKVSGTAFYHAVLRREGSTALASAGDFPVLDGLGVIDGRRARAFVREAAAGPLERWVDIWSLANLETWARANMS